ncbi:dihydrofolate reductase family protein [Baekduia soli]|uniref:dihydrofolate reductase family protein n=1 Tax=Baekduia soli TaxID=496014 RepID=UPI00165280FC|nr:dihydrofolate reductase family protein [Baekduia soli]
MSDAPDPPPGSSPEARWAHGRVQSALAAGPPERVVGVMVASVDFRAAVAGRSGGLSSEADRELLRAWRAASDLLLVGARTLEQERYGALVTPAQSASRVAAGRPPVPPIVTLSRGFDLDLDQVLGYDEQLDVTVYTEADVTAPAGRPSVGVVRLARLTAAAAIAHARREAGATRILCEGGPTLLARVAQSGLLTDLSLTVSPLLVGHGPVVLADFEAGEPRRLALHDVHRDGDFVFLHHRVSG